MRNIPLKESYKNVRDKVKETLKEHPDLQEINSVVYGERQRIGTLKSPSIWIVPEPYQPELRGGKTAINDITFDIVVLVKGNQPEKELQQAEDLAMTVYDIMVEDRTLGGLVVDVRPTRVDPAYEAGQSTQLYWSAVQFVFRLQRRE